MTNYVLNEEKMFADVTDGIGIIINSETGIYYGMNSLGTVVYENLVRGVDSDTILAALKSSPNASEDLEDNFKKFIEALVENELVVEGALSHEPASIDQNIVQEAKFALEVREYNDAQELLLADPIHEVKESTGWTPEKDSIGYTKEETRQREAKAEV